MTEDLSNNGIIKVGTNTIVRYSNALIRRAIDEVSSELQIYSNAILIVEDESILVDIINSFLEKEGFKNIDRAENGLEAINKLRSGKYELILLNIGMPILSGFEVLEFIKKSSISTKVIVTSGYQSEEGFSYAMELGAIAYLKKPFSSEQLISTITSIMRK
ncbi:MAG: response regulator [Bacteroidota bacterium]|jgi:YesN/AraC family two-component response regulator